MLVLASLFALILVAAALSWRARMGDRLAHLRRCPRCWYDMSATSGTCCPECGHAPKHSYQLHQNRPWKYTLRISVTALVLLVIASLFIALPGPWTSKVPRPVMRLVLAIVAPPVASAAGATSLPTPNPTLDKYSSSPWVRLMWHRQANQAFTSWAQAVLSTDGPITSAELARLVPMANQVNALFMETGYTADGEAWQNHDTLRRLATERAKCRENPSRFLRYEWVLAELKYSDGDSPDSKSFAQTPDSIILQALVNPHSEVREFGIDRFGRRVHQRVLTRSLAMPAGREAISKIAENDPNTRVRAFAKMILDYTDSFFPGQ